MKKEIDTTVLLLNSIVEGMFEKKGSDIVKIDLRNLTNRVADYFVICSGSSTTQVDSLCDAVEDQVRIRANEKPFHIEGTENCYWVLLDYGNVLVHIFLDEYRHFYNLESLWADAKIEKLVDEKLTL